MFPTRTTSTTGTMPLPAAAPAPAPERSPAAPSPVPAAVAPAPEATGRIEAAAPPPAPCPIAAGDGAPGPGEAESGAPRSAPAVVREAECVATGGPVPVGAVAEEAAAARLQLPPWLVRAEQGEAGTQLVQAPEPVSVPASTPAPAPAAAEVPRPAEAGRSCAGAAAETEGAAETTVAATQPVVAVHASAAQAESPVSAPNPTATDEVAEGETADRRAEVRIPGPGVEVIVADALARGMAGGDAHDPPRVGAIRPVAPTEIPVHLLFRDPVAVPAPERAPEPAPVPEPALAPAPAPASAAVPAPRFDARSRPLPAPQRPRGPVVRRVPGGDDRLCERRGPALPGWAAATVGALSLAGCVAALWRAGALPGSLVAAFGAAPRPYHGLQAHHWPPLALLGIVALLALGGLGRGKAGHAWVLTLFGRYRGTVRRTGLIWISPLLLRRRVDVRLRHWRSDPLPAVDAGGLALQVVVQVVWQVRDTARATLAVADHTSYLAEQVESALARVLSQLPADAFHEDAPTLRDAEAVGEALTRMLAAETEAVGIEVFSAQPTRIEYAPEVAAAMRRRRVAAIDAKHRDSVLTSVVDAVDDTVNRLTSRGLVELDDYERKALVKDLTVAFYTGRPE